MLAIYCSLPSTISLRAPVFMFRRSSTDLTYAFKLSMSRASSGWMNLTVPCTCTPSASVIMRFVQRDCKSWTYFRPCGCVKKLLTTSSIVAPRASWRATSSPASNRISVATPRAKSLWLPVFFARAKRPCKTACSCMNTGSCISRIFAPVPSKNSLLRSLDMRPASPSQRVPSRSPTNL